MLCLEFFKVLVPSEVLRAIAAQSFMLRGVREEPALDGSRHAALTGQTDDWQPPINQQVPLLLTQRLVNFGLAQPEQILLGVSNILIVLQAHHIEVLDNASGLGISTQVYLEEVQLLVKLGAVAAKVERAKARFTADNARVIVVGGAGRTGNDQTGMDFATHHLVQHADVALAIAAQAAKQNGLQAERQGESETEKERGAAQFGIATGVEDRAQARRASTPLRSGDWPRSAGAAFLKLQFGARIFHYSFVIVRRFVPARF